MSEYIETISKVNKRLQSPSFLPKKPDGLEERYDFPTKFSDLTLADLQDWTAKIAAWRGFIQSKLACEELELKAAKEIFNRKIAQNSLRYKQKYTKDQAEEILVRDDPDMEEARNFILEKEMFIINLNKVVDMYDRQCESLKTAIYVRNLGRYQP